MTQDKENKVKRKNSFRFILIDFNVKSNPNKKIEIDTNQSKTIFVTINKMKENIMRESPIKIL